jgi:hypothetical protein
MRADTLVEAFERVESARRAVGVCRPKHAGHQVASVGRWSGPALRVLCSCGERLKISDLEMCIAGIP